MRAKLLLMIGLLTLATTASAGRSYPSLQGTPMKRLEIRDAKAADFSFARQFAKAYLQGKAKAQHSNWIYYEGSDLLRNCIEKTSRLSDECRNSFDLELVGLDFAVGVECVEAQGLKTHKDMRSLLRQFLRESPEEARAAGELVAAAAFLRYAEPRHCPESAEGAAARADREKFGAGAASGDAEEQYQLALRTSGRDSARWLCLAANQGHAAAQFEYGKYYEVQKGDSVSAYRWYVLSNRGGYWQAPEALRRLEQVLSHSELTNAKSLVENRQQENCT